MDERLQWPLEDVITLDVPSVFVTASLSGVSVEDPLDDNKSFCLNAIYVGSIETAKFIGATAAKAEMTQ